MATERDEDKRKAWRERLRSVDPRRLVFVDESSTNIALTTRYARAPKGERARGSASRNWGENVTLVSAISVEGIGPCVSIEGSLNGEAFGLYVRCFLLRPALRCGQIVVADNLSAHKGREARRLIEGAGCELWFLPPYSPDLNPIEEAFSKVKGLLRKAKARTLQALVEATGWALNAVSEEDARGFFAHCGYGVLREQPL